MLEKWTSHACASPINRAIHKKEERRSFAFLTIVMAPVLSGLLIAAYGFLVWFYQMLFSGPPHA